MAQQGYQYEENVAKALGKRKWVKPGYQTAGARSDRPDLDLFVGGEEYGCELKKNLASAGSLVIKYTNPTGTSGSFSYGSVEGHLEKEFIKELGIMNRVLQQIKTKWTKPLWIDHNRDAAWLKRWQKAGRPNLQARYERDLENCPDINCQLSSTSIEEYYNLKNTYYLNVGTHGFFLLGSSDPAKLNRHANPQIPLWRDSHTAFLRIRIQSKGITKAAAAEKKSKDPTGGQGYQITMEMQFKSVKVSPYNIGPLVSKDSPSIQENKIILP